MLTVLAPCILPLLPVVIGSSLSGRSKSTPYVVVGSLALSIIIFTYLLKASTVFIMVPPEVWTYLSGGILIFFGLTLLFPVIWEKIPGMAKFSSGGNKLVGTGYQRKSFWGDVLIGTALGPVFSTCSPTYFVILASVLPASLFLGTLYLLAYTLGLSLVLLLIAILGERFASRLAGFSNPHGQFKKWLGILFIVLGLLIATGYEKKLEVAILDSGYFDITKLENRLLKSAESEEAPVSAPRKIMENDNPYKEIANPSGFVNTNNITIGELVGKKVILVDFLTYSCINCQRTFPYLNAWYKKYKDQGLEIIGIHTPEFAFEKDIDNVREAMRRFDIVHPIVLDNDYATWNAYGNRYWPRKYLIDIYGNVVYDHIGEGAYEETETKIQELLSERATVLGREMPTDTKLITTTIPKIDIQAKSPETYFGSLRNKALSGLYLSGTWNITPEYAESVANSKVIYRYNAKEVYIVADADSPTEIEVWQDNVLTKIVSIKESRLYVLIQNDQADEHKLELRVKNAGVRFYAFTFG